MSEVRRFLSDGNMCEEPIHGDYVLYTDDQAAQTKIKEMEKFIKDFETTIRYKNKEHDMQVIGLETRIEKLETANKIMIKALQNISSTKKSDLLENPAYWGQMIVGESSQAINQADKILGE